MRLLTSVATTRDQSLLFCQMRVKIRSESGQNLERHKSSSSRRFPAAIPLLGLAIHLKKFMWPTRSWPDTRGVCRTDLGGQCGGSRTMRTRWSPQARPTGCARIGRHGQAEPRIRPPDGSRLDALPPEIAALAQFLELRERFRRGRYLLARALRLNPICGRLGNRDYPLATR